VAKLALVSGENICLCMIWYHCVPIDVVFGFHRVHVTMIPFMFRSRALDAFRNMMRIKVA
jgi:hypothetical protein